MAFHCVWELIHVWPICKSDCNLICNPSAGFWPLFFLVTFLYSLRLSSLIFFQSSIYQGCLLTVHLGFFRITQFSLAVTVTELVEGWETNACRHMCCLSLCQSSPVRFLSRDRFLSSNLFICWLVSDSLFCVARQMCKPLLVWEFTWQNVSMHMCVHLSSRLSYSLRIFRCLKGSKLATERRMWLSQTEAVQCS